jgi:hypothetical protein
MYKCLLTTSTGYTPPRYLFHGRYPARGCHGYAVYTDFILYYCGEEIAQW